MNEKADYSGYKVRCEVWTRCVGYYRPVSQMNGGKRNEVKDRKMYDAPTAIRRIITERGC